MKIYYRSFLVVPRWVLIVADIQYDSFNMIALLHEAKKKGNPEMSLFLVEWVKFGRQY